MESNNVPIFIAHLSEIIYRLIRMGNLSAVNVRKTYLKIWVAILSLLQHLCFVLVLLVLPWMMYQGTLMSHQSHLIHTLHLQSLKWIVWDLEWGIRVKAVAPESICSSKSMDISIFPLCFLFMFLSGFCKHYCII